MVAYVWVRIKDEIWLVEYVWASIEDEWFREDAEKRSDLGLNFCKNRFVELQKKKE